MADRVVHKLLSNNRFHDDGDIPAVIGDDVNTNQTPDEDEDEHEFEFPIIHEDANSRQFSTEFVSDDQISPRYPLFDRSLLSDVDLNLCNGIDTPKTDNKQSPATATRASLIKLFIEDRDIDSVSTSPSSSEADELDGIAPGTYCVWKPKTKTKTDLDLDLNKRRGKHKKSNSISIGNTSNRWKVRDLLKRSYSDDNYSAGKDSPVFLFIPPISPEKVNINNNNNNNNNKSEKTVKTERRIPAYKSKIGNIRLPPYLPYRPDQLAAYANFAGPNRNIYRC